MSQLQRFIDRKTEELGLISPSSIVGLEDVINNKKLKFWLWEDPNHATLKVPDNSRCCYNHIIGLPKVKDETTGRVRDSPMQNYQHLIEKKLTSDGIKRLLILKARGIGLTEWTIRYLSFLILTGRFEPGSRVCVAVGPKMDLAEDWLRRFTSLFSEISPHLFDSGNMRKATAAELNGVRIEIFASYNSSGLRGLTSVKCIVLDEFAWWPSFQQQEIKGASEGYIGKPNSDPIILLISTSNKPDDPIQKILHSKDSLYDTLLLDYHYGLQGPYPIYSKQQIAIAKQSREFPREFELQPIGVEGGVFSHSSISFATSIPYNPDEYVNSPVSVGIDPGFGSSQFAIVGTRVVNGFIQVIVAEQYDRDHSDHPMMINRINEIRNQWGIHRLYVDSSGTSIIKQLRKLFGQDMTQSEIEAKEKLSKQYHISPSHYFIVNSISFSTQHKSMLSHAKYLMDSHCVLIHKKFDKLLIGLRTATASEYSLDKDKTSHDDLVDAMRLSLIHFQMKSRSNPIP